MLRSREGVPNARTQVSAALQQVGALVTGGAPTWMVGELPAGATSESLAEALYIAWYTRAMAAPTGHDGDPPVHHVNLVSALRAAHALAGTESRGWTVVVSDPRGYLTAMKGEAIRILKPGDYVMPLRPGIPPAPGEPVEPVARLDHLDAEQGIWWTFSEPPPAPPLGRVYLNACPATVVRVVHEATMALREVSHRLKTPVVPAACERVDSVVIYHERAHRPEVLAALDARWDGLGSLLDPAVPPLTRGMRPGLSWADDPDGGRSFGQSRCEALAAEIDRAGARWSTLQPTARVARLRAGLRAAGIDPERPWTCPA